MSQSKPNAKSNSKKSSSSNWKKTILKYTLLGVAAVIAACLALYFSISWRIIGNVPDKNDLISIRNYTATEIYSSDSVLLGKYFLQDRTNVSYAQISKFMIEALIATEDARFYEHSGVDKIGMMRVLVKSILMGNESAGGGSTLSQQVVKNIFPRQKYWLLSMPINKIKEAITAQKLESLFSKNDILEMYLNTVSFGENAYGVQSAAKRYFNTTAQKLTLEQAATLVGMLKATNSYNPRKHPEKSLQRRNIVIGQMLKYNYIDAKTAEQAKEKPIKLNFKPVSISDGLAPYFREHLRQELVKWCSENIKADGSNYNLYTDGLKVYTTIDSRMQRYAEQSVAEHMASLQKQFNAHWGKQNPWGNNAKVLTTAIKRSDRYRELKEAGKSEKEITKIMSAKTKMEVMGFSGNQQVNMSSIDSVKYYLRMLRAGFVVIEPKSGQVKAWVGGINHTYFKYDHVNSNTKRQVGSTFKPIVYAAALKNGVKPCEHISNEKVIFKDFSDWSPRNADNVYGGYYSMKGALTNSVNTISAQLINKAGIQNVISLAQDMGIESDLEPIPSMALGSCDASLIEMVGAYSTFANNGSFVKPNYLLKIKNNQSQVIFNSASNAIRSVQAMSSSVAQSMVYMMQNVVNEGTATRLKDQYKLYFEIAGKTGTTQDHADGWFIGYTSRLVAGAWVGGEDRHIHFRNIQYGQGAHMALPIWAKFFSKIAKDPKLSYYVRKPFAPMPAELLTQFDCQDYFPPADSLDFLDRLFGPKPNKSKDEMPKAVKEKSPKYQESWSKIRNMFKRNKN